MKHWIIVGAFAALVMGCPAAAVRAASGQQTATEQSSITVPPEEAKAYQPIEAAATATDAITLAKDFVAKYPKSAALPQVEVAVFNKIIASPKDETREANTAAFKQLFPQSDRGLDLDRALIDYYLEKGKLAEINRIGEAWLAKHPDDVKTHYLLLRIAVDGLKRQDGSLLGSGEQHGKRALAMMEGATRPAEFATDAEWAEWKKENLGLAYQSFGIIGLATGDMAMAGDFMQKAVDASPTDPLNYFFLANIRESDYAALAQKFNAMPNRDSAEAKQLLDQAHAKMDEVVTLLARTVVLSENKPEFANVLSQAKPALEDRYKQRHGNLNGLDDLLKSLREAK